MSVVKLGARFVSWGDKDWGDKDMPAALLAFAAPGATLSSTGGTAAAVALPTFVAAGLFVLK